MQITEPTIKEKKEHGEITQQFSHDAFGMVAVHVVNAEDTFLVLICNMVGIFVCASSVL